MKTGLSINELAVEINRQNENKLDFLKPLDKVELHTVTKEGLPSSELLMAIEGKDADGRLFEFEGGLTHYTHRQLGAKFKIPAEYYDKCMTFPELLKYNLQWWINKQGNVTQLIRTLDGRVRAVLSARYKRLDNYQIFNNLMPLLIEAGCTIESCSVTDTKLYIKAVLHKIQGEVKIGEPVSMGVLIENSEIGKSAFSIKPFLMFLICTNGMVIDKLKTRRYHVQREIGGDFSEGFTFSNETMTLEDEVFWRKCREVIRKTLTETTLEKCLNEIRESTKIIIPDAVEAVQVLKKNEKLSQEESNLISNYLAKGGDLTAWGLGNAVTRTAQDLESYDRATEFEVLGHKIMTSWN